MISSENELSNIDSSNTIAKTKLKLLLIEDNALDEELFREALSETAYAFSEIVTVSTLEYITEELRSEPFDLVLSDLNLQQDTYSATLDQLREFFRYCPVVLLTGLNNLDVARQALNAGIAGFITKELLRPGLLEYTILQSLEYFKKLRLHNSALRSSLQGITSQIRQAQADTQHTDTYLQKALIMAERLATSFD
ncbi:response regulator [Tunicatimonas pelagia]|uniref:response regulator n=1 Tax=Tunicatimonas pelagia TaxID=931531 RepID=UPI0026668A09|nr:response regulator [Tunicatimonas pelagia]WKN43106.1 response regulator [Tunicatimonas pelagia]